MQFPFFPMAITSASLFSRDWRIHSVHDRSRSPTDVIDRRILSKNSEFNGCSTTARVENIRKKTGIVSQDFLQRTNEELPPSRYPSIVDQVQ